MKYILWDWNGTLFDDLDICRYTIDRLLKNHGLKPLKTKENYRKAFQFPITQFYKNIGLDFIETPFEALAEEYMNIYIPLSRDKNKCNLNKEAKDTLKILKDRGFKQNILSASKIDTLKNQVRSFGIENYFEDIMGIGDIYAKSKSETAIKWKKKNSIPTDNIIFIGDSLHDLEISELIGCKCFLYSGGHQQISEDANGKYEKIDSLTEVIKKI